MPDRLRKRIRPVQGVGVNDANYNVHKRVKNSDGEVISDEMCPYYKTWAGLLQRCYSKSLLKRRPSYIGCSTVTEWHKFSNFREWMIEQDWQGKHLDKDILKPGNKVYGPDTCAFIPHIVNTFTNSLNKSRGASPIGTCFSKQRGKFLAKCRNPFTNMPENLGFFDCPNEAHEEWRKRKHELACQLADSGYVTDERVAAALKSRYEKSIWYSDDNGLKDIMNLSDKCKGGCSKCTDLGEG